MLIFKSKLRFKTKEFYLRISKSFSESNFLEANMKFNQYGGAVVDLTNYSKPYDIKSLSTYPPIVKYTVDDLKSKGINSITVVLKPSLAYLTQSFVLNDFYFHHANKEKIVLCKWLNSSCENKIPDYCHHSVGIGSIIINRNLELVLIKEKFSPTKWKFVTGLIDMKETIQLATLRETREEIGLNVDFKGVYFVREVYPLKEVNDICFFSLCFYQGENKSLQIDEKELSRAEFIPFVECLELSKNNETTLITKFILDRLWKEFNQFYKNPDRFYKEGEVVEGFLEKVSKEKVFKRMVERVDNFDIFEHYSL